MTPPSTSSSHTLRPNSVGRSTFPARELGVGRWNGPPSFRGGGPAPAPKDPPTVGPAAPPARAKKARLPPARLPRRSRDRRTDPSLNPTGVLQARLDALDQ